MTTISILLGSFILAKDLYSAWSDAIKHVYRYTGENAIRTTEMSFSSVLNKHKNSLQKKKKKKSPKIP